MAGIELGRYLTKETEKYHECIEACAECLVACDMCSEACLHEENVKMMVECIRLGRDAVQKPRDMTEHRGIPFDNGLEVRPAYLHHNMPPIRQSSRVNLGDGRGGHRYGVELQEQLADGGAELPFDYGTYCVERNRRHMVVQSLELTGEGIGQQVAAQGEHLTELLKYRTEILQGGAYLHGARSHTRPQQPVTP